MDNSSRKVADMPRAGEARTLEPGVRVILAPNPSPMTFWGTNTYLVGQGRDVAVIDPGPAQEAHLAAILAALAPGQRVSHIVVTHSHLDHSPLARQLAQQTGAPVLAFGASDAGKSPVMQALSDAGLAGGGEGVDAGFTCDQTLSHQDTLAGEGWTLRCLHTPGHMGNHICLALGDAVFSGDHVMGWASSLVSPPDGDLTDFMASCRLLQRDTWRVFYPAHGAPISAPNERLAWLIDHRLSREAEILAATQAGAPTVEEITKVVYQDTPTALLPAAERNVFAHLVDLVGRGRIQAMPRLELNAKFTVIPGA
ncbi:hydroxyacylglutathione hydrolase [Tritonibacter multivorans]|uniref:Hydroxyacylglutathione hydrolase n=2 Tax=Tritonibacter multivorans TaxID=928856 RepID=A0A0P1GJ81_9RHOB|nr:hydroxyacylglutathione hydrolase [Tritonibacter multivorans]SFC91438.1 Glyoxylase, beta-lactamase superfamily II [Tritonibacter multivorans]